MPTARKNDHDIKADIARELAWDARVAPTEIGVQVKNGIVTLAGTVDSWAKVRAAVEAAHRAPGVLDVANDLVVNPAGSAHRSDADIAQAVRHALEWDVTVPDRQIRSTVTGGIVTLEGIVAGWSQRADAERAVERLTGVRRVANEIKIEPEVRATLSDVRGAVEKALERHAAREASRIDLTLGSGGTVDAVGTVHSLREKQAVLGAIHGTRGVREVSDHLSVEPKA
jgi:osmotically-inducible protein OsmY